MKLWGTKWRDDTGKTLEPEEAAEEIPMLKVDDSKLKIIWFYT